MYTNIYMVYIHTHIRPFTYAQKLIQADSITIFIMFLLCSFL